MKSRSCSQFILENSLKKNRINFLIFSYSALHNSWALSHNSRSYRKSKKLFYFFWCFSRVSELARKSRSCSSFILEKCLRKKIDFFRFFQIVLLTTLELCFHNSRSSQMKKQLFCVFWCFLIVSDLTRKFTNFFISDFGKFSQKKIRLIFLFLQIVLYTILEVVFITQEARKWRKRRFVFFDVFQVSEVVRWVKKSFITQFQNVLEKNHFFRFFHTSRIS